MIWNPFFKKKKNYHYDKVYKIKVGAFVSCVPETLSSNHRFIDKKKWYEYTKKTIKENQILLFGIVLFFHWKNDNTKQKGFALFNCVFGIVLYNEKL